jgi:hypothetical protein
MLVNVKQLLSEWQIKYLTPLDPTVVIDGVVLDQAHLSFLRSCVTFALARNPAEQSNPVAIALQTMLREASEEARRRAFLPPSIGNVVSLRP